MEKIHKILIVDDDPIICRSLQNLLSLNNRYQVETASNGQEGLEKTKRSAYDLVITDIKMPEMNGFEMLKNIKRENPETTFIIVTGYGNLNTAIEALEAEVFNFITKPYDMDKVEFLVTQALEKKDIKAENKELMRALKEAKICLEERVLERTEQLTNQLAINMDLMELTKKQYEELLQQNIALEGKQRSLEEAYQKLHETKYFLEHIVDHYPFAVLLTNEMMEITKVNRQAEIMFSIREEEIIGKSLLQDLDHNIGLPQERIEEIRKKAESGRSWQGEIMLTKKSGQIFPGSIETSMIRDQVGKAIAYLIVIRDVTQEKKFSDQLLKAERLSIMGQLSPKVAHEINNPLQVIFANLQLAIMNIANSEKLNRYLHASLGECEKIKNLVAQLMDIAKPIPLSKEKISLPNLLEDSVTFLKNVGEIKRYTIEREYVPGLPLFKGDRFQLEQVFRNLIINASDAMEMAEEKKLRVGVRLSEDKRFIEAFISDSGCGIPSANTEKIFDPFFTTKRGSKGTGFGLAIVKDIIKRHDGTIQVESKPEEGTTFIISLPLES